MSDSDERSEVRTLTYRDCWLFFGDVDDIGWTYKHNLARKDIHSYMRQKYSSSSSYQSNFDTNYDDVVVVEDDDALKGNITEEEGNKINRSNKNIQWKFESLAIPNTFFMSDEERHDLIVNRLIKEEKCDFILSSSLAILNGRDYEYAETYKNVSWGRMLVPPDTNETNKPHNNFVDYHTDWYPSAFIAGAAAAASLPSTCAGFINAFENSGDSWGHSTGFAMGYRWYKSNYPNSKVHIITMNSYFSPGAEIIAAKQLIEKFGCNIIGKHTDPNDVDRYVYGLRDNPDGREIGSISRYVDMSLFVGDTVITSVTTDFFQPVLDTIESSFLMKKLVAETSTDTDGEITPAELSSIIRNDNSGAMFEYNKTTGDLFFTEPIVARFYEMKTNPFTNYVDQNLAEQTIYEAKKYLETTNPLCGKIWRKNGIRIDGNVNCQYERPKTPNDVISYADLGPSVIYYDVPFQDGGDLCKPGTYYEYDSNLNLTCNLCPINTYRSIEDGSRIEDFCIPCLNGTWAPQKGSSFCVPYVEENMNHLGGKLRGYGFALATLIVLLSVVFALFVHVYKKHRVVQASQPVFLYLLILGTLGMGLSIVPLAIDDGYADQRGCNIACIAFPWLLALGFSASFAALFSKIWRLNQIFTAARMMKQIKVNNRDVMIPFVIFMSLNVILLMCWTLVSPLQYERVYKSDVENESYGTCWSNLSNASIYIGVFILLINFSAVILANVQAYRARFISDEFSESRYIGLIMFSFLQILLVGIPLIILVDENPRAFFFVVSSIILILSLSLLLLIFVPKLKYVIKGDNGNINDSLFITQSLQGNSNCVIEDSGRGSLESIGSGESFPISTTSIRSSTGGVRYTNMAEVVSTLQSQCRDYKQRLTKAKAILRQHGLDVINDAPSETARMRQYRYDGTTDIHNNEDDLEESESSVPPEHSTETFDKDDLSPVVINKSL